MISFIRSLSLLSKSSSNLQKLGKEYINSLLEVLEKRKAKRDIDNELYESLKEKYLSALDTASDKCYIREGFADYIAVTPDLEKIKESVNDLLNRIEAYDEEKKNIEARFDKLEELLNQGSVSESAVIRKKREYEVLISKIEDEKVKLIKEIPTSLQMIQQLDNILNENIDDINVESAIDTRARSELDREKKRLVKIHRDTLLAAKKLSSLAEIPFSNDAWEKGTIPGISSDKATSSTTSRATEDTSKRTIQKTETITKSELRRPTHERDFPIKWKGITIGKLIGDINIVGSQFGIIGTDRPSLAVIRDIAISGPSRLRPSSNPKEIEEKLKRMILESYNLEEQKALFPENVVRFCIENKVGIDLLKLINSYYASVSLSSISYPSNNTPIVNNNAQVLTLAENAGLLGRRILAPDRNLVGVVHELYLDPRSLQLYMFAFKGVPPPVIRKIYQDTHNRNLSEGNFSNFRNEISKKLAIPIYEALTPSSMLRYSLLSGIITNLNQLATLVESMNPRISKTTDITSITSQGVLLTRFPQNTLPRIQFIEY